MTIEDSIRAFLSGVREGIRQQQIDRHIIASGQSADSLTIQSDETSGQLLGSDYFYFQINGRKAGGMPPIKSIEQWIKDKQLQLNPWAVAKSIANNGTRALNDKSKALDIQNILDANRPDFIKNLGDAIIDGITIKLKL